MALGGRGWMPLAGGGAAHLGVLDDLVRVAATSDFETFDGLEITCV